MRAFGQIIIVLFFLSTETSYANQSRDTLLQNIIFLEAGGAAGYGSLNYERFFFQTHQSTVSIRLGLGTYRIKDYTNTINPDIIVPITLYGTFGRNHQLELGMGQTITSLVQANHTSFRKERKTHLNTHFSFGYRFYQKKKGLFFSCAYTPSIELNNPYRHWAGIAFGYVF